MSEKVVCGECRWHGTIEQTLDAMNPFDEDEEIIGCPKCKGINTVLTACDEPDCWTEVCCGTPTPNGYRQTCGKHMPEARKP